MMLFEELHDVAVQDVLDHIVQQTDVKDTGLKFEGFLMSSFLKIEATLAVFHLSEICPCSSDAWKMRVRAGLMGDSISLRNREDISSGPVAL